MVWFFNMSKQQSSKLTDVDENSSLRRENKTRSMFGDSVNSIHLEFESLENRRLLAANSPPTLDAILDLSIAEDSDQRVVDLSGISDGEGMEGGGSQPLRVTVSSANSSLIPNPWVTYNSPDSTGTLTFAPVAHQYGSAVITVSVEDGGDDDDLNTTGDNLIFSRTFTVTVDPVNDAPSLSIDGSDDYELDPSFGVDGIATNLLPEVVAWSSSIYNEDGSILLGGRYGGIGSGGERFIVAKLLPNGSLDPNFGDSGGYTAISFSARANPVEDCMIVDSKGRILLGGYVRIGEFGFGLARLLPNGSLDTSFAEGGKLAFGDSVNTYAQTIAELPNGSYVVGGGGTNGNCAYYWISEGGVVEDKTQYDGAGNYTIAVNTNSDGTLFAITRNNQLDGFQVLTIGPDRQLTSSVVHEFDGLVYGAFRQSDGTWFVVGGTEYNNVGPGWLAKVLPNGQLDGAFGNAGIVMIEDSDLIDPADVTVDSQGQILVSVSYDPAGPYLVSPDGSTVTKLAMPAPFQHARAISMNDNDTFIIPFSSASSIASREFNVVAWRSQLRGLVMDEDSGQQTVNLSAIVAGGGESQNLRVTALSNNIGLIPNPTVVYNSPDLTGQLRFTPVADQFGTATITVTVEDGGDDNDLNTSGDNLTFSRTFTVTVNPVNDIPLMDPIADVTIDEDAGQQTVNLSGILPGGGESQNLRVTANSNNTGLIATPTVDYNSPDSNGTVRFTPLPDQFGTAVITVTVEDAGNDNDLNTSGDNLTFSRTFRVSVVDDCSANITLVNGELLIDGTADGDHSTVSMADSDTVRATFGESSDCLFAMAEVSSIRFLGREGDDVFVNATAIPSEIFGDEGADHLTGGAGPDIIYAGADNDRVTSGGGDDSAFGEGGDDIFELVSGVSYRSLLVDFGIGTNTFVNNYGALDFPTTLLSLDGFEHQYDPISGALVSNQTGNLASSALFDNNGPNGAIRVISDGVAVLGPVNDLTVNMLDLSNNDLNIALDQALPGTLNVDLGSGFRSFDLTGISNTIGGDFIVSAGALNQTVNMAVNQDLTVNGLASFDMSFGVDEVGLNGRGATIGGAATFNGVNLFTNDGQFTVGDNFTFDVSGEIQASSLIDNAILDIAGNFTYFGGSSSDQVVLNPSSQIGGNLDVRAGEGGNAASLVGVLGGASVKYIGGGDTDDVTLGTTGTPASINVKLKAGDDGFHLNADASIATNSLRVDFGEGDDSFSSDYGPFDFNARLFNLDGYNAIYDAFTGNLDITQVSDFGDVVIDNNGPGSAIRFGSGQFNTLTPATDLRLILLSNTTTNITADFDNPRVGNTIIQLRSGDRTVDFTGDSNTYTGLLRVEASEGVQTVNAAVTTDLNVDGTFIFNGRIGSDELVATRSVTISGAMLLRGVNTFVNNAGVDVGGDFNVITLTENEDTRLLSSASFQVGGNLTYLGGGGVDEIDFGLTGATIGGFTYANLADASDPVRQQRMMLTGGFSTNNLVVDGGETLAGHYFGTDANTFVNEEVIVNFSGSSSVNRADFYGMYLGGYGTYRGGSNSDFVTLGAQAADMLFASLTAAGDDLFTIDAETDLDYLYIDFGLGDDTLDNQLGDPLPFDHQFINL